MMQIFEQIAEDNFKGQLISKYLFGVSFWPKKQRKYCKDFYPESLYSFLGASWKLFGAACRLPY